MKNLKNLILIFISMLMVFTFTLQAKSKKPELMVKHKKFLNDVTPVITGKELKIFKSLNTDFERDEFIKIFWNQRDPTPHSPENQYKDKYYERLEYVNRFFGREENRPGAMTQRGKYYLILGKPKSVERYDGTGRLYPTEVWLYSLDPKLGVPPNFNLVFYNPNNTGYILYSPNHDGPAALIGGYSGDVNDRYSAYNYIKEWAPALAPSSITLIPGSPYNDVESPSLENVTLIQKVQQVPEKRVDTEFIEYFYKLKHRVDVDASMKFVKSKHMKMAYISPDRNLGFLDLMIQPESFSVGNYENDYYTKLDIIFNLYDEKSGKKVYEFNKSQYMTFSRNMLKNISKAKVNIGLRFPVIFNKRFKFLLYVKNLVSKEFYTYESKFFLPSPSKSAVIDCQLIRYKKNSVLKTMNNPFKLRTVSIYPAIENDWYSGDSPQFYFSVNNSDKEDLTAVVYKKEATDAKRKLVFKESVKPTDIRNCYIDIGSFVSKPGYIEMTVQLLKKGILVSSREEILMYSPLAKKYTKPFSIYLKFPELNVLNSVRIFAEQYFKTGNNSAAEKYINTYLSKKRDVKAINLKAEILLDAGKFNGMLKFLKENETKIKDNKGSEFLKIKAYAGKGDSSGAFKLGVDLYRKNYFNEKFLRFMEDLSLKMGKKKNADEFTLKLKEIDPSYKRGGRK